MEECQKLGPIQPEINQELGVPLLNKTSSKDANSTGVIKLIRSSSREIDCSERGSEHPIQSELGNGHLQARDRGFFQDSKQEFEYISRRSERCDTAESNTISKIRGSLLSKLDSDNFEWENNRIESFLFPDDFKTDDFNEPLKPLDLLHHPDYIKFPKKSIIYKHLPTSYTCNQLIECCLGRRGIEPVFILSLKEAELDSDDYKQVSQEVVTLKEFKKVLNHIEYKDCMSSTITLKSIKSYSNLVKYLLMPFVGVNITSQKNGTVTSLFV